MRGPLWSIGFAAVFACAVVAVSSFALGPRGVGPLSVPPGTHYTLTYPLQENELFVWDLPLPWNPATADADVRILAVEPVGVHGVDVVGLAMSDAVLQPDGVCLSYGNRPVPTFPPTDATTRAVAGSVLSSSDKGFCVHRPSVLIGIRRGGKSANGGIDGLLVRYVYRAATYELTLPYAFEVRPR